MLRVHDASPRFARGPSYAVPKTRDTTFGAPLSTFKKAPKSAFSGLLKPLLSSPFSHQLFASESLRFLVNEVQRF